MSTGDKVLVLYEGVKKYGIINHEYDWGSIVYLPSSGTNKLFINNKITRWSKVDWIDKHKYAEQANVEEKNRKAEVARESEMGFQPLYQTEGCRPRVRGLVW